MASIRERYVKEILAYCDLRKIKPSTLGKKAVNDPRFFERLTGGNVTIERIDRVRDYIRNNPINIVLDS